MTSIHKRHSRRMRLLTREMLVSMRFRHECAVSLRTFRSEGRSPTSRHRRLGATMAELLYVSANRPGFFRILQYKAALAKLPGYPTVLFHKRPPLTKEQLASAFDPPEASFSLAVKAQRVLGHAGGQGDDSN